MSAHRDHLDSALRTVACIVAVILATSIVGRVIGDRVTFDDRITNWLGNHRTALLSALLRDHWFRSSIMTTPVVIAAILAFTRRRPHHHLYVFLVVTSIAPVRWLWDLPCG